MHSLCAYDNKNAREEKERNKLNNLKDRASWGGHRWNWRPEMSTVRWPRCPSCQGAVMIPCIRRRQWCLLGTALFRVQAQLRSRSSERMATANRLQRETVQYFQQHRAQHPLLCTARKCSSAPTFQQSGTVGRGTTFVLPAFIVHLSVESLR